MKRRALIKHLKKSGCLFLREGGRHTIYLNPEYSRTAAVPRHTEIAELLIKKICRQLDIIGPN